MALTINFSALPMIKVFGFPVLATLAAGAGTLAAYVVEPAHAALQVSAPAVLTNAEVVSVTKADKQPSCDEQTWPYIDHQCMAGGASKQNFRVVLASRDGGLSTRGRELVTSDGVLRGPGVAPEVKDVPVVKSGSKQSETRRRQAARGVLNAVPARTRIVVRPLRLDYSSRF